MTQRVPQLPDVMAHATPRAEEERLRVGFVVHVMQVAGAEMLIAEIIRRLTDRIEPTILCLDSVGQLGELLRGEGIALECLQRRPGRDWKVSWRLAAVAKERGLQVVHAHQYTP